jgi:hypothetical protein
MDIISGSAISYSLVYWGTRNVGLAIGLGVGLGLSVGLKEGFIIYKILVFKKMFQMKSFLRFILYQA